MEQPLLLSMEWQIPVVTGVSGEGKQRPIRARTKLFIFRPQQAFCWLCCHLYMKIPKQGDTGYQLKWH